ncbi:hypothetical protein ACFX2B_013886 [Malus domestica]
MGQVQRKLACKAVRKDKAQSRGLDDAGRGKKNPANWAGGNGCGSGQQRGPCRHKSLPTLVWVGLQARGEKTQTRHMA